jgi:hypothetical protein
MTAADVNDTMRTIRWHARWVGSTLYDLVRHRRGPFMWRGPLCLDPESPRYAFNLVVLGICQKAVGPFPIELVLTPADVGGFCASNSGVPATSTAEPDAGEAWRRFRKQLRKHGAAREGDTFITWATLGRSPQLAVFFHVDAPDCVRVRVAELGPSLYRPTAEMSDDPSGLA